MIGGIVEILVGIVCTVIAILNFKGNISMLHSYHMNNIKEEDKPIFAKRMGIGMLIVGISIFFSGILFVLGDIFENNTYFIIGNIIITIGLGIGLIVCLLTIKKFNKNIFG